MPKVFLSYNSHDKPAVRRIAEALERELQRHGIGVWFDEWELQPGLSFQKDLGAALQNSAAVAVFIGAGGLGQWERPEIDVAINLQVTSKGRFPVIPVLLPGTGQGLTLPPFLQLNVMVSFGAADDERALERLVWGITGRSPKPRTVPSLPPPTEKGAPPATAAKREEVQLLGENLRRGNVTFFVGSSLPCEGMDIPPSSGEVARNLLQAVELIDAEYNSLLPPLDMAATYFALGKGETLLVRHVADLIVGRSLRAPETHRTLAGLMALLTRRRPGRSKPDPQLVVTTGLEVTLERSLLLAGVSFSRIVQHRSMARLDINQYRILNASSPDAIAVLDGQKVREASRSDVLALDDIIASCGRQTVDRQNGVYDTLAFDDLVSPLLYKFRGSVDVMDSSAITADQYFQFVRLVVPKAVPAGITAIISNTPTVFLGCNYLEPDFRVLYQGLLREAFVKEDPRYAVDPRPQVADFDLSRKVETTLWEKVKTQRQSRGITTVEAKPQDFLGDLATWASANLDLVP